MPHLKISNKKQNALIFLCWLMYTIAYLGRYSYNSNIKIIGEYFSQGKDATGLVSSMFFFFYGAGQIINGLLCKRYNKRIMLSLSLIVSAIINLVIALGVHFTYFKFLWLLNGVSQSILWSSLILVLSENLDDQHLKKAIVVMSTCVPAGTF
ncbi:MAG: MFS transporter, partial [Clostridia bacterium]|nr:MFS transporter [Clostridia bacterium]